MAERLPTSEVVASGEAPGGDAVTAAILIVQEQYQQYMRSRLEMMRGYAEVRDCRRRYLLNYFGQTLDQSCDCCDNCMAGVITEDKSNQPYPLNSRVNHQSWGEGTVMRYEGNKMVILFDRIGYKMLDVELVKLRNMIKPSAD